ncbi:MAG TPA: dienelactone hydrolase family protein [Acidimicrobiia bacterium]|nr:dienelactone hydrolase family protein [Acidimicrobiia bacterium]
MTTRNACKRSIVAAISVLAIAAGCSSSKPSSSGTNTTTSIASADSAPYAKPGPYAVGFTTLHLAGGRRMVVWYPADRATTAGHAQESIDLSSMLSPSLQAKIPAGDRVKYPANAFENAPPANQPGKYPIVMFSHGFAGFPEQSVTLTTHLASWGFVVAAPDHVERSLDGLLGTATQGVAKSTDVAVLQAALAAVEKASREPGVLQGMADPDRVVAAGHSAGAGAAYQFASADPRVKAWISYSVGFGGEGGPAPAAPQKPGMVMLGTADGIIPAAQSVKVYNGMNTPKYLVKVGGAGHLVFSDICLIGRSKGGVIGIVKAINLPIPAELLKLGSDGCNKPHPLVETAFPAINHLSVGFFRWALHIDPQPVGLDTEAVAGLGGDVTVIHEG